MPIDFSKITDGPNALELPDGSIQITWSSSSPAGTIAQLYVDRFLTWWCDNRVVTIGASSTGNDIYQVGEVGPGEESTDFSADLPLLPGTGNRADLEWDGGLFEGPDTAGFHIYGSTAPGGSVDHTIILADIPLAMPGTLETGYGTAPYGTGGYGGGGQGHYSWRSDPLANGIWTFDVIPYDTAANEGTIRTATVTISGPPNPPARNGAGLRMTYMYNALTHVATLNWLASP